MTGERIKKLRKEKGLTQQQLGEMLGVQKSAIAKYENGRVPNLKKETLSRLAEIFNVTPNYLLGIDEPAYHGHSHNIDIPLYSDVCCGDGIFVEDNIEEYISLPESLLSSRKDYFCQYADGDSMIDENIQSGAKKQLYTLQLSFSFPLYFLQSTGKYVHQILRLFSMPFH